VTNLALWLGGPEAETEMEVERRLQLDALAETFERGSLKMSFVTPAGLAAARRRADFIRRGTVRNGAAC
jgi:hypothetical protein